MNNGELLIKGDMNIIQHFVKNLNLAEYAFVELLAPYTGDIIAQGIMQMFQLTLREASDLLKLQQRYVIDAITEEWRLAPGQLEATWWDTEVVSLSNKIDTLGVRLKKLESER